MPSKVDSTRILVVDDDADIRSNICDILENLGYDVDTAADGKEALELVHRQRYDIALLDYMMPGMNGVELYREIRQVRPDLIAIMITAHAGSDGTDQARDAGTWRVLPKPLDLQALLPLIDEVSRWPIILVVDDDEAFCDNVWQTLQGHDYRVNVAHTEAEGVEKAGQSPYQAAIVDLRLNDGDGRHVIEIVKRVRPDAKLLVVTGSRDRAEDISEQIEGLCYKPVDMNQLLQLLDRCRTGVNGDG
ncbi:response regulator [Rhodopirellula sp. SWK7]|uniref:response regulator n=1 Tax=Rhodopirellula sp. SWK7 TaxID=595460 RepID=UPI0002BDC981|nr:response regulator [Rhodopirellula sp. SWK7]EMI43532.1 response regulator receiver protein [Rhodopirellula sp. SWK7]